MDSKKVIFNFTFEGYFIFDYIKTSGREFQNLIPSNVRKFLLKFLEIVSGRNQGRKTVLYCSSEGFWSLEILVLRLCN